MSSPGHGLELQLVIAAPPWASMGERETGRTPASTKQGNVMGRKKQSSGQKWHEQAEAFKCEAEKLPYGRERDELLRKARQLETASRINEWVSFPGLSAAT